MGNVRVRGAAVLVLLGVLLAAPPAFGHAELRSGPFDVELGWSDEPAVTGARNAVQVTVTDARGRPVAVPAGALQVQVAAAGSATVRALTPTETPGEALAPLVPTRPGTYALRVTGRLRGRTVDVAATCSARTFDCVVDAAEVQFPDPVPSASEIAGRLVREESRARDASDAAGTARWIAIGALLVAVVALGLVVAERRKRGP